MASLFDWSATAGSNTTVDGTSIAEGCPAGNLNNAVRSVMALCRNTFASALQTFLAGTDPLPIANGGTASTTAAAALTALGGVSLTMITGAVIPFAMTTAPSGWLECDGSAVSRTTYSTLFAAIGTTFGTGDGSTTFNLPDLRGEFVRGYDHSRGVDAARAFGSTQAVGGTVPITGYGTSGTSPGTVTSGQLVVGSGNPELTEVLESLRASGNTVTLTGDVRPVNVALMYCIKT